MDFIINLPNSNGFTTILVIIDRFFKSCRLIPMKGLPTVMETANTLFYQVFRVSRLPEDIESGRPSGNNSILTSFSLQGIIHRLMDTWRDLTRRLADSSGCTAVESNKSGTTSSYALNMHRTASLIPQEDSLHSSACWATNLQYSLGQVNTLWCQQ